MLGQFVVQFLVQNTERQMYLVQKCPERLKFLILLHRKEFYRKCDNKLMVNGPYGNDIVVVCETIPEASGKSAWENCLL